MLAAGINQWDEFYPDRKTLETDIERRELWILSDSSLIGCICINSIQSCEYSALPWRYPDTSAFVFHRLMVDPEFQGRGHAKQIMNTAEINARSLGAHSIRLDAFLHNPPALRLYDSLGYERVGMVHFRKGPFVCFEKLLG